MIKQKKLIAVISCCVIVVVSLVIYICIQKNRQSDVRFIEFTPDYQSDEYTYTNAENNIKYPINLNTATLQELVSINGIGTVTAEKIIEYRNKIGIFKSVYDLLDIDGIGEKNLQSMLPFIYVEGDTEDRQNNNSSLNRSTDNISKIPDIQILNINTATKYQLMTLDGIGDSKSDSIIEYRSNISLFYKKEDIMKVNGIGQEIFNKIKDRIITGYENNSQENNEKVNQNIPSNNNQTKKVTTKTVKPKKPEKPTATKKPTEEKNIETRQTEAITTIDKNKIININKSSADEMVIYLDLTQYEAEEIVNHRLMVNHPYTSKYELLLFISTDKLAEIFNRIEL